MTEQCSEHHRQSVNCLGRSQRRSPAIKKHFYFCALTLVRRHLTTSLFSGLTGALSRRGAFDKTFACDSLMISAGSDPGHAGKLSNDLLKHLTLAALQQGSASLRVGSPATAAATHRLAELITVKVFTDSDVHPTEAPKHFHRRYYLAATLEHMYQWEHLM